MLVLNRIWNEIKWMIDWIETSNWNSEWTTYLFQGKRCRGDCGFCARAPSSSSDVSGTDTDTLWRPVGGPGWQPPLHPDSGSRAPTASYWGRGNSCRWRWFAAADAADPSLSWRSTCPLWVDFSSAWIEALSCPVTQNATVELIDVGSS